MKKANVVKADEAEIDWAAEFGEDDEFTVGEGGASGAEHRARHDRGDDDYNEEEEEEEVEILLKQNRDRQATAREAAPADHRRHHHHQTGSSYAASTYSIRNGDVKLASALSVAATSPMSIGKASHQPASSAASSSSSSLSSSVVSSVHTLTDSPSSSTVHRFEPPMPRIDLDTHHVVSPSPYGTYMEIRTMASTIKIISLVHLMMCLVYILLPSFKWMIFPNLAVAAVGLWGAFVYSARLTVAFMSLVCLNVMLMVIFMLIELLNDSIQSSIVVIGVLFLIGEIFIMNYCYQFWKKLPSEGFFAGFSQFFSSNEPRIGGFVMTDVEEGL